MGQYKGKRITLTLNHDAYTLLLRIKHSHRFPHLTDVIRALIGILDLGYYNSPEYNDSDSHRQITDMFRELAESQPTPDGNPPVRHNNCYGKGC